MKLEEFLNCIFPGDEASGLPNFSECSIEIEYYFNVNELNELKDIVRIFPNFHDNRELSVDDFIRHTPAKSRVYWDSILAKLIELYFSNEKVLSILRPDAVTLFPNNRSLEEIDYDLLIPLTQENNSK